MEDETTTTTEVETDQNLYVEDVEETQETDDTDTPTLEDYRELEAKYKKEQKEKEKMTKLFNNARNRSKELPTQPNTGTVPIDKEELILYSKGLETEDIELARKVATVENVSLMEATKTDMYQALKERQDAKMKSEKAQLPASRGSQKFAPPMTFESVKNRDDHYQLWLKTQGRV